MVSHGYTARKGKRLCYIYDYVKMISGAWVRRNNDMGGMSVSTLLWILAVLDLIGGLVIGNQIHSMVVGITVGVIGFAILGGFATVIDLLKSIDSKISRLNYGSSGSSETQKATVRSSEPFFVATRANQQSAVAKGEGWKCPKCGKTNFPYETSCSCGASRFGRTVDTPSSDNTGNSNVASEDQDSIPHIFYCRNCGAALGATSENKPEKCHKCFSPITETSIARDTWRTMSSEQKIQALFDDGVLTREEYDEKKKSLAGQ